MPPTPTPLLPPPPPLLPPPRPPCCPLPPPPSDADPLRKQALLLSEFAHETALAELGGLRKEPKVTQRFRAPQTLAVLRAADKLMRDVDAAARPAAHVSPEELAALADAIAEVEPMAGSAQAADDDELDDEI